MIRIINFKLSVLQVFLLLAAVNFCLFLIHHGSVIMFSDFSREVYIPYAMNNNDLLYKDIFNVYAPLGYQINAFLLHFFPSINTFYAAGFINSTFILWGLYLILRFFLKQHIIINLSVLILIISSCFYTVSATNYITPYSYSAVYALNTFIWSVVCLLYFLKKNKNIFLYMAFLLMGFSVICKYEFSLFLMVLLFILYKTEIPVKNKIISLLLFFLFPLISIISLLLQGIALNDLKTAAEYINNLANAKSVKVLYTYLGFIPTFISLKSLCLWFFKLVKLIIIFPVIPFCINSFTQTNAFYFNWIGLFTLLIFIIKFKKIYNDKLFFIFFISVITASLKCIFNISFNSYGTYYFPLLFICSLIFTMKLIDEIKNLKFKKIITVNLAIGIIFLAFTYCASNINRNRYTFENNSYNLNIRTEIGLKEAFNKTISYIKDNTKKEDRILVLPEGAIINYLTDRKSDNKYYYLIPPNIEIFGEENIVKDLEKNLPEYIILTPFSYNNFKETFFCESFGIKICGLLPKYYEKPIVFGSDFWLAIYKRKN